jgi:hypothetical protein
MCYWPAIPTFTSLTPTAAKATADDDGAVQDVGLLVSPDRRWITELSSRTFWTFCARVLAISVRQAVIDMKVIGFGEGLGPSQEAAVRFSRDSVEAEEFAIARTVGLLDHAAALVDGHVVQDADGLPPGVLGA